jgi:hypothetical protein
MNVTATETGINIAYVGADPVLNENLSTYCTAPDKGMKSFLIDEGDSSACFSDLREWNSLFLHSPRSFAYDDSKKSVIQQLYDSVYQNTNS